MEGMEGPAVGTEPSAHGTPMGDFPADPCRSELASDRGIHAQSDRRLLRHNALNVVMGSHS
jgi:hypothetical protein